MDPALVGYLALFSASAVVCLASVPRARQIPHPGTREGFVVLLVSVALWAGGYAMYLVAPTNTTRVVAYTFGFISALFAVGAFLYFCAAYTGRPPRQAPYRHVIGGVFAVIIALKLSNPLHELYFTTTWTTEPFPHLAIEHGILYWLILGAAYAVIAVGFFMLIERFYHTGADSRPLIVLLGLTALPALFTVLGDLVGLLPLMYEPPGVALFAVGMLYVYDRRFEAIRLTGGSDEAAIFLDPDGRIRDYNQAAVAILPGLTGALGDPIDSVAPALAVGNDETEILTVQDGELVGGEGGSGSATVTVQDPRSMLEVSRSPFLAGEVATGTLLRIRDVTERERYRKELEARTEQLAASNEQLAALNRVIRHDIRNDMTVIIAWTETLQDHVDDDGEEALDRILNKSEHVVELTDLAGDFVESLTNEETLELKPMDLGDVLETELAAVRSAHPEAALDCESTVPSVTVRGNELLASVFRNLLENAINHNDTESPAVMVRVDVEDERVRVRVADNGPGIDPDQREALFEKGVKGAESSGTGIGLYLVRTLTEQFGGEIWVEANEPRGAVFVVELPRA